MSIIKDLVDDNYRAEKVAKLEAYRVEGFVEGWNEAIEAAANKIKSNNKLMIAILRLKK